MIQQKVVGLRQPSPENQRPRVDTAEALHIRELAHIPRNSIPRIRARGPRLLDPPILPRCLLFLLLRSVTTHPKSHPAFRAPPASHYPGLWLLLFHLTTLLQTIQYPIMSSRMTIQQCRMVLKGTTHWHKCHPAIGVTNGIRLFRRMKTWASILNRSIQVTRIRWPSNSSNTLLRTLHGPSRQSHQPLQLIIHRTRTKNQHTQFPRATPVATACFLKRLTVVVNRDILQNLFLHGRRMIISRTLGGIIDV
jgi:hypothetical protein